MPDVILLLEHFVRLEWLEKRNPVCVAYLSAVAARREDLSLAPEFPSGLLIEETLDEMRGVIGAQEFEALWEQGQDGDPVKLLHGFFETKNRA